MDDKKMEDMVDRAIDKHTREVKELDAKYKQVDTYVAGLSLHADLVEPLKAAMRSALIKEMEFRVNRLVGGIIAEEAAKIESEEKSKL